MRHVFLPGAVGAGARGMVATAITRALVTPAGSTLVAAPGLFGTSLLAVDVAAVATRADHHQDAAACARIEAPRCISFPLSTEPWTRGTTRGILPRHTCSRTVWGAAPIRTSRLGSAPCLSSRRRNLEARHCPAHGCENRAGPLKAAEPPRRHASLKSRKARATARSISPLVRSAAGARVGGKRSIGGAAAVKGWPRQRPPQARP
jgi:hypothetical protein